MLYKSQIVIEFPAVTLSSLSPSPKILQTATKFPVSFVVTMTQNFTQVNSKAEHQMSIGLPDLIFKLQTLPIISSESVLYI